MVKRITIEEVSNGWVVYNNLSPHTAPEILVVFNDIFDLTAWLRPYLKPPQESSQ